MFLGSYGPWGPRDISWTTEGRYSDEVTPEASFENHRTGAGPDESRLQCKSCAVWQFPVDSETRVVRSDTPTYRPESRTSVDA